MGRGHADLRKSQFYEGLKILGHEPSEFKGLPSEDELEKLRSRIMKAWRAWMRENHPDKTNDRTRPEFEVLMGFKEALKVVRWTPPQQRGAYRVMTDRVDAEYGALMDEFMRSMQDMQQNRAHAEWMQAWALKNDPIQSDRTSRALARIRLVQAAEKVKELEGELAKASVALMDAREDAKARGIDVEKALKDMEPLGVRYKYK